MNKIKTLHPIHQVYDGVFNSYSRQTISLREPTADMINIDDVAMGLNNICRFGGQIPEFYSVLQHSLLVYALAPKELGAVALLHDASEAYLGDVIKPLKVILDYAYTDIEDKFTKAIFEKFAVDIKLLPKIKQYDKQALDIEHDYFFNIRASPLKNILSMYDPPAKSWPTAPFFEPAYSKIFIDLVYKNCPGAVNLGVMLEEVR